MRKKKRKTNKELQMKQTNQKNCCPKKGEGAAKKLSEKKRHSPSTENYVSIEETWEMKKTVKKMKMKRKKAEKKLRALAKEMNLIEKGGKELQIDGVVCLQHAEMALIGQLEKR